MKRLLIALLVLPLLAFTITLDVDPAQPVTAQALDCVIEVTGPGTLQANLTWYKNNISYADSDETLALTSGMQATGATIPSDNTTRDEEWVCQATVYNETHTETTNSTPITIQNSAPIVLSPTGRIVVYENDPYFFTATATDPDQDPYSFASVVINATGTPEPETPLFTIDSDGTISFTPTYEQVGNHTIGILATDGDLVGGRNVIFEIRAINEDPYFVPPLQDQETTQEEHFSYVIQGYDREDDPFNFTMQSPLQELQLVRINDTHAEINFTTQTVEHRHGGIHQINVTIYETQNTTKNTTEQFILNVTVFNELPEFDLPITSPQITQGDEFNLTVTATDQDPEDTLLFSIETTCPIPNPWTIETQDNSSTSATGNIYVAETNNDHVACRDVSLIVTDYDEQGFAKNQTVHNMTLNITNVNDPPTIHELSGYANQPLQQNISSLVAPTGLEFRYRVNATDPDMLTYEGDELTYTDNATLFTINQSTGWAVFTPGVSDIGNHTINITVQDLQGATDSKLMELEVIENNPPTFINPGTIECDQDENCTVNLTATDPDQGDVMSWEVELINSFVWSGEQNLSLDLNLVYQSPNTTTAWNNFTNNNVGWFEYHVTVRDLFGAEDNGTFIINVSNINDPPRFDPDILFHKPVVETHETLFFIHATDPDFVNIDSPDVEENLTLTADITGPNPSLFTPIKQGGDNSTQWVVQFTPQASDVGDYTVNFTLTDLQGLSDTDQVNFTVHEQSLPPNITAVRPWYDDQLEATEYETKGLVTDIGKNTSVELAEGGQYTFNISYEDPDTADENVTIRWYVDGNLTQERAGNENYAYTFSLGYFDEGHYNYTVVVEDNRYETDRFDWFVEVLNTNRPPVACYDLADRNITQTTQLTEYMYVFYDPDDHPDHTQPGDECSSIRTHPSQLTYDADIDNPNLLEITFDGEDVTITPVADGTTTVTYRATDPRGATVESNVVTYDITVPEQTQEPTPSPSTGGGGAAPMPIPMPVTQDPEPISINIITPSTLVMYRNQTMEVPIAVHNPTDTVFEGVDLQATVEVEDVHLRFTQSTFPTLQPDETRNITLFVENYRSQGTYEILVEANVLNPEINDSATIFVNALEQESFGDAVHTRVSFAQDLLSSNPECLELNEYLQRARTLLQEGRTTEADILLREVVDACRYLVAEPGPREEIPSGYDISWFTQLRYANAVLLGLLFVLLGITALLLMHYYQAAKED